MMGRLVGDPKISYSKNGNAMAIARYRLAVARKSKKQGEAAADFFSCVVFGKSAEFAERYLHKGTQICISGRLQTGSYVNNENQKVTTTEIVVEDTSFAGPKQENTMPGNVMPNNQGYGAYAQQQNGYQTGPNNMQMKPRIDSFSVSLLHSTTLPSPFAAKNNSSPSGSVLTSPSFT